MINSKEQTHLQVDKILQKLFTYADNKDLNINRIRNLIVNPEILRVLIQSLPSMSNQDKIDIIGRVAQMYKKNSLNLCILFKRDKEIMEFNHSIFDEIVTFMFNIKVDFEQNQQLFQAFQPLISGYPIGCRNIKNIISKIAKNFHFEHFSHQKLQLSLLILKELFKSQTFLLTQPKCFFYMYGPNSGIKMINQEIKWSLHKGMYFYINFCIQSYQHEGMNLLNIVVNDDTFQLSIDEENMLSVKVFSGNKIYKLRRIQQKKWYFLKLAYCLRTGIIRNTYELVAHIEAEPFELRDLPMPSPTIKDNIDELIIGHEFYGRINFAAISRNQLRSWPKSGINNWGQIQGLLAANKQILKDVFLFYSPLVTTKINQNEIIYEITNKNHAQILDNTAMHNNPFDQVDINYYGGLYTLIPFFYILRFYKFGQYKIVLEDIFDLLLTIFQNDYQNIENQAINCQLFAIISDFINEIDERYINIEVINKIASFKDLIQSKLLKKQYLQSFLLKIRIDRIADVKVIQKLHEIISSFYYKDFKWSLQSVSLYEIIWYIIDNFEPEKKQDCCILHSWQQNSQALDDNKIFQIEEHYKLKCIKIKELLKYIIKNLINTRSYNLLIPKKVSNQEHNHDHNKKNDKFSIFEFLKFEGYSICLKKMLLQCLQIGVHEDPHAIMKETELLECLYSMLSVSELRDQITPVISILNECSEALKITSDPRNLEIYKQIGKQLDKFYIKKYADIRLRSKSQGIGISSTKKKSFQHRKMSDQLQQTLSFNSQSIEQKQKQKTKSKQKDIKSKIVKLKKQKKIKISNDKELYDLLTNICCKKENENNILIHDDCTKIINPYFKICCSEFRVKLIEMIRTTVLVGSRLENNPPNIMENLSKFDHVYRFVLSQVILKELYPEDPSYQPSPESNYIIKNFFYIVDHMVIGMRNNWDSLYLFLLRMVGILTQAKKQIHQKTERSKQQITMACKVCVRKFILRILKHTQKSIQNMGNMVFLVYLVAFNNHEEHAQEEHIFQYFESLEKHFLIGPISILNQDEHKIIEKNIFIDEKIILSYLEGFKMQQVFNSTEADPLKYRKYTQNLIKAYLQLDQTNELQDYLYKLYKVFISKSKFQEYSQEDHKGIRNMISNYFIGGEENKNKDGFGPQELHVCEIIGLLLCLVIESSLNTSRQNAFKVSLDQFTLFVKSFSLAFSRDCLKRKDHAYRIEKIPKSILYHLIHFLYQMMQNAQDQKYKNMIQETLYNVINYITLVMSVLSEKVGNPDTLEDLLMLSTVMLDVEQYNFYIFGVLEGVITLNEIRMFSTLPLQKGIQIINHPNMKKHFKIPPKVFLQKHIQQVVLIHQLNIEKVQKQLQQKFQQPSSPDQIKKSTIINNGSYNNQFEEYRLEHARKLDLEYRNMMKVWRKVWKRLRLYHYYWSVSMDQREQMGMWFEKFKILPYKHKFGKYTDLDGLRPILQVEPNEPWHVKKAQLEEQVKYRNKNFMINLYKPKTQRQSKQKSLMDRILRRSFSVDYFKVLWIKHNSKRKGRLSITSQKLIFQYESTFQKDSHVDFTSFTLAEHRPMEKTWSIATITNILNRRYLMRNQCLLIQFEDSSAIIFDFLDDDSEQFLNKIEHVQAQKSHMHNFMKANKVSFYLKKFKKGSNESEIEQATQQWCEGKITNLHYLMILNKYSGRSYLDPVNYPVMPWIISNCDCKQFVYRDLSKTLGALGSQNRRLLYETKVDNADPFNNVPPYQYGTHYSSPGVVFNFLIRISPYTQAARTLQGGKFDLSDRLFSSINVCWHSVTNQVSDVRELNPQFFYLPQFLINIQNHDFGLTQLKERIDHVKIPIWATNAYDFIYQHRRALEGDQVSKNINNWIDLIFGYKQKGKIAKENLNLFYYLTYQDSIDLNKIQDSIQRTSIQAQIIHFGQTPRQLFTKPHPEKKFFKNSKVCEPQKIKFLGSIQSSFPILLLGQIENNLIIFNNSTLISVTTIPGFERKSEVSLLRNSSKQRLYFVEDISINNKVVLFGNNKFVAVSSYVNGDLVIYNVNGKKLYQHKSTAKSVICVNKKQNLLLCGCKNGLLEVYEIVYAEKEMVNLIKIISEYYMFPIEHISEGAGFFSISAGNLVVIKKISRGLNYIYDKVKMQGAKMIRSFESKRKVYGSYICRNPLYCVVFFNTLQVYIYSINGQFLKLRQIENIINPIIIIDYMQRQNILVLTPNGLLALKIPQLDTVWTIPTPKDKEYIDMKIINDKLYLVTANGEVLYVFNQKQMIFY